jgi:hypothetical protein
MKVATIIMGFGDPYWDKKIDILKNNMKILDKWKPDYFISQYTLDKEINIDTDSNLNIIKGKGILGQLLFDNWHPDKFVDYDYVMILLDDIELQNNFNLDIIVALKNKYNLNIVSPTLTTNSKFSHRIMITNKNKYVLKETKFCELFCYIMDYKTYETYYRYVDRENPWIWGMDTILCSVMGFKVGILNNVTMKHYFKGSGSGKALSDMHKYLKKYNVPFKLDYAIVNTY